MSIPDGPVVTNVPLDLLPTDAIVRPNYLVDYELAGIAIGDPSAGMEYQQWECRLEGDKVNVFPSAAPGLKHTVMTSVSCSELTFSFDQNMNPAAAIVEEEGVIRLFWYDPAVPGYTSAYFSGYSPFMTLDDKRLTASSRNDMILFYRSGYDVRYRVQRERFLDEHVLITTGTEQFRIMRVGMGTSRRVQLELFGIQVLPA